MTVRLTDNTLRHKEQWAGRVYDNGATLYFTTARRDNKQAPHANCR